MVVGAPLATQTPAMVREALDRQPQPCQCKGEGVARCQDPHSLQCLRCQGWDHMARECPTPASVLNQLGGTEGMWLSPPQWQLSQPTIGPSTFPPKPLTRTDQYVRGSTDMPTRSDPNNPMPELGPNCSLGWMVQWGLHHCWWAEDDCIDWLWGTGLQHKLWILWTNGHKGLPTRQATWARGYLRPSYPVPGVHGG